MKELQIAAVQTLPVFGAVDANINTALEFVPAGCDLAVLPELFSSGYQFTEIGHRDRMHRANVILYPAPLPHTGFAIAGAKFDKQRMDGAKVRRLEADGAAEQPASERPADHAPV